MWHQHAATPRRRVVAVREAIKSHVKYDAVASPRVGVAASRAAGTFPARPAGSCAVPPPRVACAAAAASTAAVGPGVVTGPARRDSTHRDAAHAACRPVPLRGRASRRAPARPAQRARRGRSVSSTVLDPERTTGRSANAPMHQSRSDEKQKRRPIRIRARPDEPGAGPTGPVNPCR